MNDVILYNESDVATDDAALARAVQLTLAHHGSQVRARGEVTILLTSDERVRSLNREYRAVDSVTDVLSFPALQHGLSEEPPALGDLVVAMPWTARQARHSGMALMDCLCLLMVHGTLHLLGHSHETPEARARMWALQDDLLRRLGLAPELVPRLEGDSMYQPPAGAP